MDYITIADIKGYTGLTYTAEQEALLTSIGTALEDFIERYCNRSFKEDSYIEKFDGGVDTFIIANPPIITITSVKENGEELVEDEDFFNYGSYIQFPTKAFSGHQNIEIEYVNTVAFPEPLKSALIEWVIYKYNEQVLSGGSISTEALKSISVGPVSVNYGESLLSEGSQTSSSSGLLSGVPEDVADVLKLYRKSPL